MSKRAFSAEYKFEILKVYEEGNHSINEIASTYKVASSNIMEWKHRFEKYGVEGLQEASSIKKYSKELKLAAIQDYLSGQYSIREVIRKYEISSSSVLRRWMKHLMVIEKSRER